MTWNKDRVGGLLLLLFFITYSLLSQNITLLPAQLNPTFTAKTLPHALSVLGICGALWLVLRPTQNAPIAFRGLLWGRFFASLLLMSLYGLMLRPLGFLLATGVFLSMGFLGLGERRWLIILAIAGMVTLLFWWLMHFGLGVYLPPLPALFSNGA